MARKNGDIAFQILQMFSENSDRILTTKEISDVLGIHKSSVSRCLTRLSEMMLIEKIKAGHYRFQKVDPTELGRPRTMADNERMINTLLSLYDKLQQVVAPATLKAFERGKHKQALKALKDLTDTMDVLISRWNKINRGYDANLEQARQDVKLKNQTDSPTEEVSQELGYFDLETGKLIK